MLSGAVPGFFLGAGSGYGGVTGRHPLGLGDLRHVFCGVEVGGIGSGRGCISAGLADLCTVRFDTPQAAPGAHRPPGAHRAEAAGSCGASAVLAFGECPQPVRGGVLLAVGPGAGAGVVPPSGVTGALLGGDGRRGGGGPPRAQGVAERAEMIAPTDVVMGVGSGRPAITCATC